MLAGVAAHAQPIQQSATPAVTRVELRPVEQGIGDVSPLSANLRSLPTDLRMPIRFDRVYRLSDIAAAQPAWRGPGRSFGSQPEGFVRFNAGVSAVFPYSAYTPSRDGFIAEVPPGTVFHLGLKPQPAGGRFSFMDSPTSRAGIPLSMVASSARPPYQTSIPESQLNVPINRLVDTSAAANPPAHLQQSTEPRSLWTSEAYRHERLSNLITGARNTPPLRRAQETMPLAPTDNTREHAAPQNAISNAKKSENAPTTPTNPTTDPEPTAPSPPRR